MIGMIYKALEWLAKGGVQAFMVQAGLSVVVMSGLDILVTSQLNAFATQLSSANSDLLNLALIGGLGEFISITGAALVTRVGIVSASNIVGINKAATS